MKIKVPRKNYEITELYDTVAELMGMETKDIKYDCKYITTAMNIQEGFFARYREDNPTLTPMEVKMMAAGILLCFGPKLDESLEDDEVEVFDGFIC